MFFANLKINRLLPFISLLLFFNINGNSVVYYLGLGFMAIILGRYLRKGDVHTGISFFVVICILSLVFNEVSSQSSSFRFIVYLFILLFFSPWFENLALTILRQRILFCLLHYCIYVTCISFFLMLSGVIPQINPKETSGGFAGITSSSMTMAPIAVISVLYGIYRAFSLSERKSIYIIIVGISMYVLMITGSRSALAGGVVALSVYFFIYYKKKLVRFFFYFFFILALIVSTYSYWFSYLTVISKKVAIEETMQGQNSRSEKWGNRIEEFKKSPFIGVGVFSVDKQISKNDISETGNIEYGSSWLALLSTTGILGFMSIFCLFCKSLYCYYLSDVDIQTKAFVCAISVFFGLHLMFEGYLFGVGNVLTIIFWLLLSVIAGNMGRKNCLSKGHYYN